MKKPEAPELSIELEAISALVNSLSCHMDTNGKGERLTESQVKLAMFGIRYYLERVADDVAGFEEMQGVKDQEVSA